MKAFGEATMKNNGTAYSRKIPNKRKGRNVKNIFKMTWSFKNPSR